MVMEGLIGENPGGANLDEVAGELTPQHAVLVAAEKHLVAHRKRVQVVFSGVFAVIAHAAVALNAAVHLMMDKRAKVLIAEGSLGELIAAVGVAGHHGHVLKMALPAFVAHGTIVRVALHQPLDDAGAKLHGVLVFNRNAHALGHRGHAGHHQPPARILLVAKLLHRALAAGAHRAERRVPAEIRQI